MSRGCSVSAPAVTMNYKPTALLGLSVMVLMIQWAPGLAAPLANCSSDFKSIKSLIQLLEYEARLLHRKFISHVGEVNGSAPPDVPGSSISGRNISEQLRDIYVKLVLFSVHIAKVEEYQREIWKSPPSVATPMLHVQGRLSMSKARMRVFLRNNNPEVALPTVAVPEASHEAYYAKKKYSYHVVHRLKDCLAQVVRVMEEADGVCDHEL